MEPLFFQPTSDFENEQVIDTYTGELVMHTPYDAVRGYFVEALLVISILVISRLTFVRNNTYTTTVVLDSKKDKGT